MNVITNKRKLINCLGEHITAKCSKTLASNLAHVKVHMAGCHRLHSILLFTFAIYL